MPTDFVRYTPEIETIDPNLNRLMEQIVGFISAKAMATIEFLQQEWINDGNFIGIGDERDPIIGLQEDDAAFTIPKDPVRRLVRGIETFNVLRGGEYFFMPSISGLNWLANGFQ